MDMFFENQTVVTKEILADFFKRAYKIYGKLYRTLVLIAAIVDVVFGIVVLIFSNLYLGFVLILCGCIFFLLFFKGYRIRINQNYNNLEALHGEQPQFTFTFFADNLERKTIKSSLKVNYSQITNLIETHSLYILMIEKQGLILNKSGFTVGSADAFKAFIQEKCNRIFR